MEDLKNNVLFVAKEINGLKTYEEFSEYLDDSLSIEYTKTINNELVNVEIAITLGGPNIYLSTKNEIVNGYWGNDNFSCHINNDDFIDYIIDTIEAYLNK